MRRRGLDRRSFLATALSAASIVPFKPGTAWAGSASPQCPAVPPPPSQAVPLAAARLGTLAAAKHIAFGVQLDIAYTQAYGPGMYDPVYRQTVFQERPQVIAYGSAFKFGTVCPDPPSFDGTLLFTQSAYGVENTWYAAEDLTSFTKPQGAHARADALIWNVTEYAPSWLKALPPNAQPTSAAYTFNRSYVKSYMSAAMKKMTQLQAGQADFFLAAGLVNEPIVPNFASPQSPGPAYYRDGPWLGPGHAVASFKGVPDYIHDAFFWGDYYRTYWAKQLRQPPTTAHFFVNETLCETDQFGPVMRPALLTLLKAMLAAKLNVKAVGLECHLQPQMMNDPYHPDWTAFGAFIHAIGALGLDVYITELDVFDYETSCSQGRGTATESDALIATYYSSFLNKVLAYPNVKQVTLWDLSDRYTFYRTFDVSTWYGYSSIPQPRPANTPWPSCPNLPASATAIACPRPDAYDDAMLPKAARTAIADAFANAPSR